MHGGGMPRDPTAELKELERQTAIAGVEEP